MRAGFIQFTPVLGDIDQNITKISRLVYRTDADLVVLPELCNTGYHFTGKSQITGPDGSILCRGGEATEESGVVEIDPTLARNKAINPYNDAFGSRRIECYGELMKQRPR